jgi:hypothetical protein
MLTVRNQIGAGKIRNYLSPSSLDGEARAFCERCSSIKPIPGERSQVLLGSHTWALKTLLHNMLRTYFGHPNLSALFFPQVRYEGTKIKIPDKQRLMDSPMLHWLVLCRFGDEAVATPDFWPIEYLSKPSVKVQMAHGQGRLIWESQTGEGAATTARPSVVEWLSQHGAGILNGIG